MIYGYARVSTKNQRLGRQVTNIKAEYPAADIFKEYYTGTSMERPGWIKLKKRLQSGDVCIFDSVSRMSRTADEGFRDYRELYEKGVELVFLNEPHINTSVFKQSMNNAISIELNSGNDAVDEYFSGNIALINKLLLKLAEEQIKVSFREAEKQVLDLHRAISDGIKASGKKVGISKGTTLETKKAIECRSLILEKMNLLDSGELTNEELIKILGISRNSYFKYKKQVKEQ